MRYNYIDDILTLNTGDESGRVTAATANLNVYVEYSLELLGLGHSMTLDR
jgi:hypothetical protein